MVFEITGHEIRPRGQHLPIILTNERKEVVGLGQISEEELKDAVKEKTLLESELVDLRLNCDRNSLLGVIKGGKPIKTSKLNLARIPIRKTMPGIVIDHHSGDILVLFNFNREAVRKSKEEGALHRYSESRNVLEKKGASSGNTFTVRSIETSPNHKFLVVRVNADKEPLTMCHEGTRTCYERKLV